MWRREKRGQLLILGENVMEKFYDSFFLKRNQNDTMILVTDVYGALAMCQALFYFIKVNLFNPHHCPLRWVLFLCPFFRWEHRGLKKVNDPPKIAQYGNSWTSKEYQRSPFKAPCSPVCCDTWIPETTEVAVRWHCWQRDRALAELSGEAGARSALRLLCSEPVSSDQVPHLTKECLVALRCGRDCADLKMALRQEFCNLEEVKMGPLLARCGG